MGLRRVHGTKVRDQLISLLDQAEQALDFPVTVGDRPAATGAAPCGAPRGLQGNRRWLR